MLRAKVTISTLAYDVVWQDEGLQDKHLTLQSLSPGATDEERAMLERQAWQELQGMGLANNGRAHPDLIATMHLLARPQREFYGWFNANEDPQRSALAAATGDDAVLAQLDEHTLTLQPVRVTGLADALLQALPDRPPARGQSFNLPADAMEDSSGPGRGRHARPDEGGRSFMSAGGSSAAAGGDGSLQRLRQLLAEPRTGGGQLYAACRDRLGHRRRAAPLTYIDLAAGRYMAQKVPGSDGSPWVFVAPADRRTIAQKLNEMASSVAGR